MITISNIAKNKLIDLIKNNGNNKSAFLYLKGGGCNGFSYKFKILNTIEKPNKLDEKYDLDGYDLFLCNKSLLFIIGTHIDYIKNKN
jgi:Fe-S cluster assembly iron-binding protein IscA